MSVALPAPAISRAAVRDLRRLRILGRSFSADAEAALDAADSPVFVDDLAAPSSAGLDVA